MRSSVVVMTRALSRGPLGRAMAAFTLFSIAEWAAWVALLVWAYGRSGVSGAATVSVAQLVPALVLAPLGSVLGDRMHRGRALTLSYALQGLLMGATAAAIATDAPFALVCLAGAAVTTAITLTRPVHHAVMPELARSPDELTAGNAASTAAEGLGTFLGPLVSGLLIVENGAEAVFAIFGLALLGSAALTTRLPLSVEQRPDSTEGPLQTITGGVRELRREPATAVMMGTVFGQYLVIGVLDILLIVLALDVLGTDESGPGLLGSALGLGAIVGGLASLALVGRPKLLPALATGLLVSGLPLAFLGWSGTPVVAALLLALSGVGKSLSDVATRTLMQRVVTERVLARVFGLQESLMSGAIALGAVLTPALVAGFGTTGALVATGLVLPVAAVPAWRTLSRLEARALPPGPDLGLLRSVGFLRLAPAAALESLSRRTARLSIPTGTSVVQEGRPGDRFYVVLDGSVEVTRKGQPVRRLGEGDTFGEVALLQGDARTATVIALEPTTLVSIGRHDFLRALGTGGSFRSAADDLVSGYLESDRRLDAGLDAADAVPRERAD